MNLKEIEARARAAHIRKFIPLQVAEIDRDALIAEVKMLREALSEESKKFQQETRRTSDQAVLLRKWRELAEHHNHVKGPWSRGCGWCELQGETAELLCRPINERKIITEFVHPPIPIRSMDWQAYFDGDEPDDDGRMMTGSGSTEAEAISDLRRAATLMEGKDEQ